MHTLTIVPDITNYASREVILTSDVIASLQDRYAKFPDSARLYCGQPCKANDVTPATDADIEAIAKMKGDFYCIVYPADPVTLLYIAIAIVAIVAVVALSNRPKLPTQLSRNNQSQSPNNALSGRTNTARVNGRIPDIYGTVRSTPDLIAVPYTIFKDNIEYEYCFMCIGRGVYDISADTVRDGQTVASKIEGESVEIFAPGTSPNLGSTPQLRIGEAIDRPVISTVRSKSVNGQVLLAPNDDSGAVNYSHKIGFNSLGEMANDTGDGTDFTTDFHVGQTVRLHTSVNHVFVHLSPADYVGGVNTIIFHADGRVEFPFPMGVTGTQADLLRIEGAIVLDGVTPYDFSGRYLVSGYAGNSVILDNPIQSNANWGIIASVFGGTTPSVSCVADSQDQYVDINLSGTYTIASVTPIRIGFTQNATTQANNYWKWLQFNLHYGDREPFTSVTLADASEPDSDGWVGPFVLDVTTMDQVIANFVALNGMYKDDGTTQTSTSVDIQVGCTPCTSAGVATAGEQYFTVTIVGSNNNQSTKAITLFGALAGANRYMVRARRLTPKDLDFSGNVVDEVKWRDVYASSPVGAIAWGNVTTVHAVTQATQQALAVSERQLNMLVTRKLPQRISGSTFGSLVPTNNAADIISYIALDPKLGNRKPEELDFDNIYATVEAVKTYFDNPLTGEFCYTFDNDNLSFEEMLTAIAQAIFCTAHRRGQVIELTFEKVTPDSRLLFNHRNKIPGTEKRTTAFGQQNNNDGIEYDYVSPVDDAVLTFYIPEDRTAVNPKKIESIGVRNLAQAYLHAYREYNKMRYQNRATEFDATQEAEILAVNSRILVADNTRPDTQDGEIEFQDGLMITLSQPAVILSSDSYVICLQHISGIVEIIDIASVIDPYHLVLATPPMDDLITESNKAVKTLYQIVRASESDNRSFLITEKKPKSNFVTSVTAVNYDARYYANDLDMSS